MPVDMTDREFEVRSEISLRPLLRPSGEPLNDRSAADAGSPPVSIQAETAAALGPGMPN